MRPSGRRRLAAWARGKSGGKMGSSGPSDRHKMGFMLVVVFMAVFGLIVLAEVLFVDQGTAPQLGLVSGPSPVPPVASSSSLFAAHYGPYRRDMSVSGDEESSAALYHEDISSAWETPEPIKEGEPVTRQKKEPDQSVKFNSTSAFRDDKLQKSMLRHQQEIERLIKNLSARLRPSTTQASSASRKTGDNSVYDKDELWPSDADLDFQLLRNRGLDAVWQPVAGTSHKFYVYSAYFDSRGPRPLVRVIGATRTKHSDNVSCRFYYSRPQAVVDIPGRVAIIRENWNLKYTACFILCPLPDSQPDRVPPSVSILSESKQPIVSDALDEAVEVSNQLPVLQSETGGTGSVQPSSSEVGVCVKPMHFHYSQTLELIEFIELNKLLGAPFFTLYNDTVSSEVDCVLRYYAAQGTVKILSWKLNLHSQKEIRTEGLFAALNDCLYRNMNHFRYLMFVDLDEFIVPHMNDTIPDMLSFLEQQRLKSTSTSTKSGTRKKTVEPTSSFSFQNAFFYTQFSDDEASVSGPGLRVLRKTRRKVKFNPQKQRSKFICVPRNVKEVGNHFIWEYQEGRNVNVPTSLGFLHHYRVCEFGGDDCIRTESRVDRTLYKYRDRLVANVYKVVQTLSETCQLERLHKELLPIEAQL